MYKAIILPRTTEDIKQSAIWYNSKQKGLGKLFTKAVRDKTHFIRQNPKAAAIRYDDIRTAVLDVFPFMIHYTVEDKQKIVVIVAVFHTSRDPLIWKVRNYKGL